VFPGPEAGAGDVIAWIEREFGPVPLATKLFWLRVGSVDLCGSHPNWTGCEYPDPLVVNPPSHSVEVEERRINPEWVFRIPVAPDFYHKEGVSGGMWYSVGVPAIADDPPLNDEWHHTSFLSYLELAIQWGGFPGLERCPQHTWPIELLRP
jgi:hypothetical protein